MPPFARILRGPVLALALCATGAAVAADAARVQSLLDEGRLPEALKAVDEGLRKDAKDVTFRFLKGLVLARMDRLDESAAIFEQLTREHPELPEPYNNLAVVYAARGDFEKARQALQRAINTHPAYATAHENLGDIYAKMASQAYNHALELDQDNATARAKLALVNDLFSLPASAPAPAPAPAVAAAPPAERPAPVPPEPRPSAPPAAETKAPADAPETVAAAAPPAAAAPAPVPSPAQSAAAQEAVRRAVDLWASAWSAQDVAAYTAFYAEDFTPDNGQSRDEWIRGREKRLKTPSYIRVEVSDLKVTMLGPDHARADFTQSYQSNTYSDRVGKTLLFKRKGDRWLITLETAR
jgi:tetratricopeptide (TPR) repeat protein